MIACVLIPVWFDSSIAKSNEKTFRKSLYYIIIFVGAWFCSKAANKGFLVGYTITIDMGAYKIAIYTTNVSKTLSKAIFINLYLSISSSCLAIGMASAIVYFFYVNFLPSNLTSALLRVRKDIIRTIFILVFANKKIFSKNQALSRLS